MPASASAAQPTVSYLIVAYRSGAELERTLPALAGELEPGDEVIVVDNDPTDSPRAIVSDLSPEARLVEMEGNAGFAAGVNRAASEATGDLLLLLNPDAKPEPGFGSAIRRPFSERPDWGAWMALVTCRIEGERVVNTWGNPVHFTGISWAGGHGSSLDEIEGSGEIKTASGAALAVRSHLWRDLGGFPAEYFLYHEDTDLSLRVQSTGNRIGLLDDARVDHDYEFSANEGKWFWLERNRLATIVRNYPGALLALVTPALVFTELALLLVSARQGWLGAKLRSYRDLLRWLPRLRRERRRIQSERRISPSQFAELLTPDLDSPMIPAFVRTGVVRFMLRAYWWIVRAVLR